MVFIGEDGIDAGGVKKEFFQLLIAELLCPDYGMLVFMPVCVGLCWWVAADGLLLMACCWWAVGTPQHPITTTIHIPHPSQLPLPSFHTHTQKHKTHKNTHTQESRTYWFNPCTLEAEAEFLLVGLVLGLAIYNGVILDFPLPLALYKRLLGLSVTLRDLEDMQPTLGRSLKQLLTYEGGGGVDGEWGEGGVGVGGRRG